MRYLSALALMAVAVLTIGTNSTEVFAKRPSNPPELEQRVTDLEGQVVDHEARVTALEAQSQPLSVYDGNGDYIGQLVSIFLEPFERITVFIPSVGKFMEIQGTLNGYAPTQLWWYDEPNQNFEDYIPGVTPPDIPLYEPTTASPTKLHFLLSFYDFDHYRHFTKNEDGWLTYVTLDFSYPIQLPLTFQ